MPSSRTPAHRLAARVLLTAGRAIAGQHLSPTRRRRKASSNSLPAFRAEQSVRPPGWDPAGSSIPPRAILSGATGVCRPRRSREQIRHSSTPQESGVVAGPQAIASWDQPSCNAEHPGISVRQAASGSAPPCDFVLSKSLRITIHVRHTCARLRHECHVSQIL